MTEKFRMAIVGAIAGFTVSLGLALPTLVPASMADEQPVRTFLEARDSVADLLTPPRAQPSFVKPDFDIEASVSQDVLSTNVIRKIEFGRTSFITIATTSTGVYSSDAMDSPHVRYPGVHAIEGQPTNGRLAVFAGGKWELLREINAKSFVEIVPFEGGQYVVDSDGACAFVGKSVYC